MEIVAHARFTAVGPAKKLPSNTLDLVESESLMHSNGYLRKFDATFFV